mgnify:FL=1
MEALQRQLTYSKKRTAFAWAKYYEELSTNHEQNINHYNINSEILNGVDEMPSHIVIEIEKMTAELKKQIECPICLDVIQVGGLKISGCGHKYCGGCFTQIDKCAICRRKINHKK